MKRYLSFIALLLAVVHNAHAESINDQLLKAATLGKMEDVKHLLVDPNINVNFKGAGNQTALQKAASQAHSKVVQLLLNAGANPNSADKQGITPLMAAIMSYPSKKNLHAVEDMVSSLIAKNANVNAQNAGGQTALMLAVATDLLTIVALLLDANADISLRNSFGQRAIDLVNPHGGQKAATIKALLEEQYERGITKGWEPIGQTQVKELEGGWQEIPTNQD